MLVREHPWLEGLETPFFWRPSGLQYVSLLPELSVRERESRVTHRDLTFNNYVVTLLLACELYTSGNATAAMSKLADLEMDLFRMDIVSNCSFYLETRRAQWHCMLATRATLLASEGQLEESQQVVAENFDQVSVFNSEEKAAIYGIKSRVYLEYGPQTWHEALKWAKEAVKLNPKEAEWHFLVGLALENIRLESGNSSVIPTEEIWYFGKAVISGGRGNHMIHLADVYDHLASQIQMGGFHNESVNILVCNLTSQSFQLLRSAMERAGNNTETRLYCVEGLLREPHRHRAKEELKIAMGDLLSEPKEIRMLFRVAGKYYLKLEEDKEKAIQYFSKGSELGDYSCSLSCLRLRHDLGQVPDVEEALRHLVARYRNYRSHCDALSHLGAWVLLEKGDEAEAVEIFREVLENYPKCRALLVHDPIFLTYREPFNLLRELYTKVSQAPKEKLSQQQKDDFLKILASCDTTVDSCTAQGTGNATEKRNIVW